jgi:hypothetical protein
MMSLLTRALIAESGGGAMPLGSSAAILATETSTRSCRDLRKSSRVALEPRPTSR